MLQAKEDMVASSELKSEGARKMHGHIPGIIPGDVFSGKGECAAIGIHGDYGKGISCKYVVSASHCTPVAASKVPVPAFFACI